MASVRPEDFLEDVYQIRFYDEHREPPRTTNSLRKSEYTYAEAKKEAKWREQLYERGEHDPWVQEQPEATAGADTLTVKEGIECYVEVKTEVGRQGGPFLYQPSSTALATRECRLPETWRQQSEGRPSTLARWFV